MDRNLPPERLLAIIEMQNEIAATALELDAVMTFVVERAQELTGADGATIELAEGDHMVYRVGSGSGAPHVGLRLRIAASLSGRCVQEARSLNCEDADSDPRVDAVACRRVGARSMVCVPLSHGGRAVGVLKVFGSRPHMFHASDVAALDLLSGVVASHMTHAQDFAIHHHNSRHDALTGLPNRRAFDERLRAEIARVRRHGGALTLCLLDLDRFKQVNDTAGHAAGDEVLRAVAGHLQTVRCEDAAHRIGGDEFGLILIAAYATGAEVAIGRIRAATAADPACRGVGISAGVASLLPDDDATSLLRRADLALYEDKDAIAAWAAG